MDAGNMLKPALARGELHCVGATTLDEYRQYVEKDAALERRFQKVLVDEPSVEDTIAILRGLKERYEVHHGVDIGDPAIVAASTLSHRYISDRQLPDKAIDLIDEAASRIRMEIDSKPESMDRLERRLIQLKIEREALGKESDDASRERLARLESEIAAAEREFSDLEEIWNAEKAEVQGVQHFKEALERARTELETAQRGGDLTRMAELQYGRIPELEKQIEHAGRATSRETRLLRHSVTEEEIAGIVSKWTGIPVTRMLEGERDKLLRMEEALHARVVGQDEAVGAISNAIRRARGRALRSETSQRIVPLPRPHRGGQDRAHSRTRGVPVRLRGRDDPDGHVRIHGEALGRAPHRRSAGVRRIRGRGIPDRGNPAPPLVGGASRRSGKGPLRRLQRAAPGARGRTADGRTRTHRGFSKLRCRDDVEPRFTPGP